MESTLIKNMLILHFKGEVNSSNIVALEEEVNAAIEGKEFTYLILNFADVTYISSVGLRLILKLKQKYDKVAVAETSLEVYDVFRMTGFTNIMDISKKLAVISVDGCQVIGDGFFSTVYRLNKDTIVKVFKDTSDLGTIQQELNLAKQAFVLGIPTAISYDVVRVGDRLGVRFEMLDSVSLRDLFRDNPKRYDELVGKYAALLKKINTTESMSNDLRDARGMWFEKADACKPYLTEAEYEKLHKMLDDIEVRGTFVHGDCHVKNIMSQGDELFLIDMETLCKGHPIYELGKIHSTYIAFSEDDPGNGARFLGLDDDFIVKMFHDTLDVYFGGKCDEDTWNKISIISYTHMVWWAFNYASDDKKEKMIHGNAERLKKLIARYDDLEIAA